MDTTPRSESVEKKIQEISRLIDAEDYAKARKALDALAKKVSEQHAEVIRYRSTLDFLSSP